jgi:hypothetical protein
MSDMMRHVFSFSLLLSLLVLIVAPGQGQEKTEKDAVDPAVVEKDKAEKDKAEKDKAEKDKAEKDKAEKDKGEPNVKPPVPMRQPPPPPNPWVKVGQLTGRIRSYQESDRSIALTIKTPELNVGAVQGLAQAQARMAQARFQPPQQQIQTIQQAQIEMLRHQNNMYNMRDTDVTLKLHDDVKVRMAMPPPTFDEKGRLVTRYSQEQLREMKGSDPSLPGYNAEITDISPNQVVSIVLVQHREKMRARPQRPMIRGKNLENADADLIMDDNKPQISVVVILGSPMVGN